MAVKLHERPLCLISLTVLIVTLMPHAWAQPVLTVPVPAPSGPDRVLDFYAGGTSDNYVLQVSPQGGSLAIGDYVSMGLMPWGYVTAQWPSGTVYIIFLVNVTETNFRIGFLYLTNSSDEAFMLRLFDYGSDNIQVFSFQGVQHVYNRTVSTAPVAIPKLQIPASAKVTNGLSALGPQLSLGPTGGEWLNGTTMLSIYPLYNQYFTGENDYDELWSLLVDNVGNYYFAILYMPNSDNSHIIIEHQLRLNDYVKLQGVTVDARWVLGSFVNRLSVTSAVPNLTVKIDGFPFQTNQRGVLSAVVPSGYATIEVPSEIAGPNNSKFEFSNWSHLGSSNPLKIVMNATVNLSANFTTEYWVSVNSPYGSPQGSGWYPYGTKVKYGVTSPIYFNNGTRLLFVQWEGDSKSASPQNDLTVDSAKQISAIWKTQYALTISAPGLPPNATADVLVGNESVTLQGPTPVTQWVDALQQLTITVQNQRVEAPSGNYSFSQLRADNQTFAGLVIVTQPITVWVMYAATQKSEPAPAMGVPSGGSAPQLGDASLLLLSTYALLAGKDIPLLTPMIGLTASLARLGYLLATILVPGGPPIAGYLLGSLFIGMIYVLPVSALLLLYRVGKTKRKPSLRTLVPLAVVWAITLALILLSPNIGALQGLVATLQILLMIATMLLFPLAIAFRMAKLVA